jgi:hypothetical protein
MPVPETLPFTSSLMNYFASPLRSSSSLPLWTILEIDGHGARSVCV